MPAAFPSPLDEAAAANEETIASGEAATHATSPDDQRAEGQSAEGQGAGRPVVLFDGSCNLCHRLVAFLSRVDERGTLCFAPLESETGRASLAPTGLDAAGIDGLLLVEDGQTVTRSEAVWRALRRLPPPWPTVAGALRVVPRRVRDAAYDVVARHRYRFFGRADRCPLPLQVPQRRP
jgi:predicted DCC family thiol-disulfide oxidoreductase YuxK